MRKMFDGKLYNGEITECGMDGGSKTYKVAYEEDGDVEVMLEEDMHDTVVKKRSSM